MSLFPFPITLGKVVFHRYSDYQNWDARLYMLDLASGQLTAISENWSIDHEMNAHISPDGTQLVFMGDDAGEPRDWDIYLWTIGMTTSPVNLTHAYDLREEDPKFSPNGQKIVFKQGHWDETVNAMVYDICEMNLSGEILNRVTDNLDEESMPFYTTDGSKIVYARGEGSNSDIYCVTTSGSQNTALMAVPNVQEYYPIVRDASTFLFTAWVSAGNHSDQICLGFFDGSTPQFLPFNSSDANYSDAYPCDKEYSLFSSTRTGGQGGYDLYIGSLGTGEVWSLLDVNGSVNSAEHELGSCFYSDEVVSVVPMVFNECSRKITIHIGMQMYTTSVSIPELQSSPITATFYTAKGVEVAQRTFQVKSVSFTKELLGSGLYFCRFRSLGHDLAVIPVIVH